MSTGRLLHLPVENRLLRALRLCVPTTLGERNKKKPVPLVPLIHRKGETERIHPGLVLEKVITLKGNLQPFIKEGFFKLMAGCILFPAEGLASIQDHRRQKRLSDLALHRGNDDQSVIIVDTSSGKRPFKAHTKGITLSFDGQAINSIADRLTTPCLKNDTAKQA